MASPLTLYESTCNLDQHFQEFVQKSAATRKVSKSIIPSSYHKRSAFIQQDALEKIA